ncbi:hypothetical protein ACFPRL_20430 [Pseudoclavibacter helvolus]
MAARTLGPTGPRRCACNSRRDWIGGSGSRREFGIAGNQVAISA